MDNLIGKTKNFLTCIELVERPEGDGMFTYEERDFYLTEAKNAIKQALLEQL